MIARKIHAMHRLYGETYGQCKDCPHFIEGYYHDRKLFKCEAYGVTHSEATDWRKSWSACKLIDLPLPEERPVIDRIRGQREHIREEIPGQMEMDFMEKELRD